MTFDTASCELCKIRAFAEYLLFQISAKANCSDILFHYSKSLNALPLHHCLIFVTDRLILVIFQIISV